MDGILFSAGVRHFSLVHTVPIGSGTYPASYSVGIGRSFPSGKVAGVHEADDLPQSNAEVSNGVAIHTSSWHELN
jgi:hypothetical protein